MDSQGRFGCRGVASSHKIIRYGHLRRVTRDWTFLLTMLVILLLGLLPGTEARVQTLPDAAALFRSLPPGDHITRTEAASRAFLGRSYSLGPLGEGDSALGEAKPRLRLDSFDCVTYLETSLALALAQDSTDILAQMDSLRYREGQVLWRWRNHFFEGDWLPHNSRRVRPVRFPDDTTIVRRLARARFYAQRGFDVPDTSVALHLLWRDRAMNRFAKPSDSARFRGVALVGKVDGYPVLHTGFLLERPGQPALLRHASQAGTVREQPFSEYLREKPKFVGVIVWDVLP